MRNLLLLIILCITSLWIHAQQEKLEIAGAIKIGNSEDASPAPGTIRFNPSTNDFEGHDGSDWRSLTKSAGLTGSGIVTDIDGNQYPTVTIGTQVWMRENLRTSRYNDGTPIEELTLNVDWASASTVAFCWFENNHLIDLIYGKLYNWYAVDDARGLCPTGWHVPTDLEWTTLIDHLDPVIVDPNAIGVQSNVAGGKMKETGLLHWASPNTGATNESGFTGLPGGFRSSSGSFFNIGNFGSWWSSTESGANAWGRDLNYLDDDVYRYTNNKRYGSSVRCVRDD